MFIKVTRSAAVSALAAGREVRLDSTGEILKLRTPRSKRACRRILSCFVEAGQFLADKAGTKVSYSVRV